MQNIVYVQLANRESACRILGGAKVEVEPPAKAGASEYLVVKDNSDKVIGRFASGAIAGWWIERTDY